MYNFFGVTNSKLCGIRGHSSSTFHGPNPSPHLPSLFHLLGLFLLVLSVPFPSFPSPVPCPLLFVSLSIWLSKDDPSLIRFPEFTTNMWIKLVSEPLIRELESDETYMASGRQPRKRFARETDVATLRR